MFKGKVYKHHVLEKRKYQNLNAKINDFKNFWYYGFSPKIGKDVATKYPDVEGNRHVHLKPLNIEESKDEKNGKNGKKKNINFLHRDANFFDIPTSNIGFLYFVDRKRNLVIVGFSNKILRF